MTRVEFERRREADWATLEKLLTQLESKRRGPKPANAEQLPLLYRATCEDLSLARYRGYGGDLVQRLNELALRAYHQLHGARRHVVQRAIAFLIVGFPRLVRANGRVVSFAMLCFFGPFFSFMLAGFVAPDWVIAALPEDLRTQLEESFSGPPDGASFGRTTDSNVMMFGFYVRNNVGIDFRTFAGGMLFGLGSIFFLVYNGIVLGAAFGYAFLAGFEETFMAFTSGHGGPELLAVGISGAAGLRLGLALLAPGRRTRRRALREDGRVAVRLVLGAGAMTTFAALIEAFWSATPVAAEVKYVVGAVVWIGTLAWLLLAGRWSREDATEVRP